MRRSHTIEDLSTRSLYTAQQSRDVDRMLVEQTSTTGYELMQRAGRACFSRLIKRWPAARNIVVYTGTGNNGGDGYVIAHLLQRAVRNVKVCQLGDANHIKGDALKARREFLEAGGETIPLDEDIGADLLVDAIFGSGLNRDLSQETRHWIDYINARQTPTLSVDIPSGLDADRGCARPVAVKADITVSFITRKRGMYTAAGKDCCGRIFFEPLQNLDNIARQFKPACRLFNYGEALQCLPSRRHDTHKKDFGHVLVIGGNHGMAGAVCLASKAALYSGAGLVSVLTRTQHITTVTAVCPPLMVHDAAHSETVKRLINNCDVIVIGPGLGTDTWAIALMSAVLDSDKALVVDADALRLLAKDPLRSERWILTPHPGEAAHLLNTTTSEIQKDRFVAAQKILDRYGGACVLKGAGTIVATSEQTTVCEGGNAGMSSAGMGDVLSGVIASLQAQGLPMVDAAPLGPCIHARAGDIAAANIPRGLTADIVINYLRTTVNDDK